MGGHDDQGGGQQLGVGGKMLIKLLASLVEGLVAVKTSAPIGPVGLGGEAGQYPSPGEQLA